MFFGDFVDLFGELFTAFLGEWRNGNANQLTVIGRI